MIVLPYRHDVHDSAKIVRELPPAVKPVVETDVLTSISPEVLEDAFVYVHCYFQNDHQDTLIRVWRTTFLVDAASGARSPLVHAENISYAPQWTLIPDRSMFNFLLIFSALPKTCRQFDLVEEIAQPGGFFVKNVQRNTTDVYHIHV